MIKWVEDGKAYYNHVFTKNSSYEVMRAWTEIIAKEEGLLDEISELKQFSS